MSISFLQILIVMLTLAIYAFSENRVECQDSNIPAIIKTNDLMYNDDNSYGVLKKVIDVFMALAFIGGAIYLVFTKTAIISKLFQFLRRNKKKSEWCHESVYHPIINNLKCGEFDRFLVALQTIKQIHPVPEEIIQELCGFLMANNNVYSQLKWNTSKIKSVVCQQLCLIFQKLKISEGKLNIKDKNIVCKGIKENLDSFKSLLK